MEVVGAISEAVKAIATSAATVCVFGIVAGSILIYLDKVTLKDIKDFLKKNRF